MGEGREDMGAERSTQKGGKREVERLEEEKGKSGGGWKG